MKTTMEQNEKVFYESSYQFKLIKAEWGIYANIKAKVEPLNESTIKSEYRISDLIWFSFNGKLIAPAEDKAFMLNGIKSVCKEIEVRIDDPIIITLTDFQISPCDYQKDGMYYAFAHWAANHFGFTFKIFNCYFDSENNKYVFPDLK